MADASCVKWSKSHEHVCLEVIAAVYVGYVALSGIGDEKIAESKVSLDNGGKVFGEMLG